MRCVTILFSAAGTQKLYIDKDTELNAISTNGVGLVTTDPTLTSAQVQNPAANNVFTDLLIHSQGGVRPFYSLPVLAGMTLFVTMTSLGFMQLFFTDPPVISAE
jgi:hypothetical protein